MNENVDLSALSAQHSGTPRLLGHLARPEGTGPWPGVVVIFEAIGADAVNLRLNERMAAAGYLALMPDLYTGRKAIRCMVPTMRQLAQGHGPAFADIEASRQWLLAEPSCTGKIGVIGFCMGGGFALVLAGQGRFDAAAANYGQLPKELDKAMEGACPVVASYGGRDKPFRANAAKLESALQRVGVTHDVKLYPKAGHSFLSDAENVPRALAPVMRRITGFGPEPESAADAWQRIDAFFGEHLTEK
ncbi:dienelactone hydrolase family protein [Streptomyces sp. NPDC057654]|uniref:dienelactone hydrolase family protein n=1 Tax=Streptomyces sp. NPDC057654 TaxID=3346196 RepID=UPI0036887B45